MTVTIGDFVYCIIGWSDNVCNCSLYICDIVLLCTRDSIYAIACICHGNSVCPSICLSHGWISQKRL